MYAYFSSTTYRIGLTLRLGITTSAELRVGAHDWSHDMERARSGVQYRISNCRRFEVGSVMLVKTPVLTDLL